MNRHNTGPSSTLSRTMLVASAVLATVSIGAWTATTVANTSTTSMRAQAPVSIATINLQKVLGELNLRSQMETDLQSLLADLQSELTELNDQREGQIADLEMLTQGSRAYQSKVVKIREMEGLLQYRKNLFDQQILIEKGRILRELYNKIEQSGKSIAQREGYQLVLIDDSTLALPQGDIAENNMLQVILGRRVMVNSGGNDISDLVIQLMNSQ